MDLTTYDWIVLNSSAGKDSQAMLDFVVRLAREQGVMDRLVVVHADLGRVEWAGTQALAARQAAHYGLRFEVVRYRNEDGLEQDLLAHVESKRKWPGMGNTRYCTSDHKRGPVGTLFKKLVDEWRIAMGFKPRAMKGVPQVKILNCMGLRAQESTEREAMVPFRNDERFSNSKRIIDIWLPIHAWTVADVWRTIGESGVEHHPAYDLGMPRLSCVFCIYAQPDGLMLAGKHNRELLAEYVRVEQKIGHKFNAKFSLESIQARLQAGEQAGPVADWAM